MMNKGFDDAAFMRYLEERFSDPMFARQLVDNIIAYAHKHEQVSKDMFVYFVADLVPGMVFGEVAQFAEEGILTEWGKSSRQEYKDYKRR